MPSISMGMVAFWGADASWNEGIYVGDGINPLQAVADTTTANPSGGGNFTAFTGNLAYPGNPVISGRTIAFFGAGPGMMQGTYAGFPNTPVRVVADLNTNLPGGSGKITTFTTSAGYPPSLGLDGHNVALWAGGMSGQQGIYLFPGRSYLSDQPDQGRRPEHPHARRPGQFHGLHRRPDGAGGAGAQRRQRRLQRLRRGRTHRHLRDDRRPVGAGRGHHHCP